MKGEDVRTTIYTPIPFYISEILLSLFLSYILFNVNDNQDHNDMNKTRNTNEISHIILYSENPNA